MGGRSEGFYRREGYFAKIWRLYKVGPAEYQKMLAAQDNSCAICRKRFKAGKNPALDHDHRNGRVRGLLCTSCNVGLGNFQDDPLILSAAQRYLYQAWKGSKAQENE